MESTAIRKPKAKRKNAFIEYMRFFVALIIMAWHFHTLEGINRDVYFCQGGNYGVEFFALLSGFLMARSLAKYQGTDPLTEASGFMKRKWLHILQMNVVAYLFAFVLRQFPNPPGPGRLFSRFMANMPEMLLLSTTGLKRTDPVFNYNGADWYLSAMFLAKIFNVPIRLKAPKLYRYFCMPAGLLLLGLAVRFHGGIATTDSTISGILILGNFRIGGELLIGSGAYEIYARLRSSRTRNPLLVYLMRIIIALAYAGYILLMLHGIKQFWGPALVIILTMMMVFAFLYYDSDALPGRRSAAPSLIGILGEKLGTFSFALYLNHRYWVFFLNKLDLTMSIRNQLILCTVLSVISSFICTWICRGLSALWKSIYTPQRA